MSESSINLTDEEKKQMRLKRLGGIGQKIGVISGITNSILPNRSEYQGEYGGLSQSLDSGYNSIANGISQLGPAGQFVESMMQVGAAANKLTGLLGGGTDGMCVCAGTKVFKANGEIINIEKLQKEDGIIGWNTHKTVPQLIHDFVEPRYKQCVEIVLKNGTSLKCSIDHPILNLISNTWEFKRADKLKIGDIVGLAPNVDYWGDIDNHNAYTIGYSLKDDLYNEKSIKDIRKFNKISTCKFLAGLFDSNGNVDDTNSIILSMSNINLLKEISLHLHKLGIFSILKTLSKHKHILKIKDSIYTFYKEIPVRKFSCDLSELNNEVLSEPIKCEIASITHIGIQVVYNLQADYDNTYLANGIITHNTKTDSILGSSFLGLTPIGLINGFGGKRAKKFGIDQDTLSSTNGSYDALLGNAQSSANVSGKKFGLFSSGARRKDNRLIDTTSMQQNRARDIIQEGSISQNLVQSMSAINANKYALQLQGGYDPDNVRLGRHGMSIKLLEKARTIIKAQQGAKISDPFQVYLQSLPENQRNSTNYRVKDYWEYNGRPKDFEEAKGKGMFVEREDFDDTGKSLGKSWHGFTVAENPNTGELEFMKSSSHPTIQKELDWYNSDDGTDFRSQYELIKTEPYYKYVKRKTPQHKNGGSIIELISETTISLVNPLDIPEFQNGGSINVIPDGALHARKHNMDLEGITEKGIPVVSEKDNGKIEQQAEIEKEEVIFRLEVTQKLEELEKKYYSEEASQKEKDEYALEAGKLITEELLHNTKDNAGLL